MLDAKGEKLATSDLLQGQNIGYPAEPKEINAFMSMIEGQARRIEPGSDRRASQGTGDSWREDYRRHEAKGGRGGEEEDNNESGLPATSTFPVKHASRTGDAAGLAGSPAIRAGLNEPGPDPFVETFHPSSRDCAFCTGRCTGFEVTPIRPTIAVQDHLSERRLRSCASRFGLAARPAGRRACCFIKSG